MVKLIKIVILILLKAIIQVMELEFPVMVARHGLFINFVISKRFFLWFLNLALNTRLTSKWLIALQTNGIMSNKQTIMELSIVYVTVINFA